MRSFNVLYAGQLRFVECARYHLPKIKGAKSVDAVFVKDVQDDWCKNIGSKYSIDNLTFEQALQKFNQTVNSNSCTIVDPVKYNSLIDITTRKYFQYQQLFLTLDHLTDADVIFLMTPELVFNPRAFLNLKLITLVTSQSAPNAYGWVTNSECVHNHFMYFNRLAIKKLKENWKKQTFYNFKNTEAGWYKLIKDCGVNVVPTNNANMVTKCLRYKPNMDFNKIKNYKYLNSLRDEWSLRRDLL
jgi:hypothetical protein